MGNRPKEKEKISGQLGSSDLFQNKLDEIDKELRKFEDVTSESRDKKGVKSGLRSLSVRNGFPVSVAVGLGLSKSGVNNLNNIGPLQTPTNPTPTSTGFIDNSHSPTPLGLLSPRPKFPCKIFQTVMGK